MWPVSRRSAAIIPTIFLLAGCVEQSRGAPQMWYAAHNAVPPRETVVSVCHGFGCHLKTAVTFSAADVKAMAKAVGRARTAAEERQGVARLIAWTERRVAPSVGSEGDVPGLDLSNAGVAGQMDCIDEAANTTSYLLIAAEQGLLRHHTVGKPVARGFFIDGRYPHATATLVDEGGTAWAVDAWPTRNGAPPEIMPLETWFATWPTRG
jgi:hypothetical protein